MDSMKERSLTHEQVLNFLPDRDINAHKGNFGKLLLLCGSRGFTGAAYLATMGALRCGAGLVYLGVPESIYAIEAVKLNEPVVFPLPEEEGMLSEKAVPEILKRLPQMDAVLIGCGLGQSVGTMAVLEAVLKKASCPVVVDADGINLLARHKDLLRGRTTILTPHAGGFNRLGGAGREDGLAFAKEFGCILLLKGHNTLITDGERACSNPTGNPGMAVGGSGDLLSGMITALLGQGLPPMEAAACGHGSTEPPGISAPGSWASTPCCQRTCWGFFLDF